MDMPSHDALDTTRRRATASVIGGTGGAAYVVINASAFGQPTAAILRVVAVLGLAWIVFRAWWWRNSPPVPRRRQGFGRAYWMVVAVEVVLIIGGRALIVAWLGEPRYFLPWLSLVVGLHFFAFAWIWHRRTYVVLGLLVSASAVVAGVLVASAAGPAAVTAFATIVPGVVLLAFGVLAVPSAPPRGSTSPAPGSATATARETSGRYP